MGEALAARSSSAAVARCGAAATVSTISPSWSSRSTTQTSASSGMTARAKSRTVSVGSSEALSEAVAESTSFRRRRCLRMLSRAK